MKRFQLNGSVRYGFNKKITSMHSNEGQFDKGKGARLLPCSSGLAFYNDHRKVKRVHLADRK